MIWGSKCHQNNSPVIWDGHVKYEEAEFDRLVAILKTNNCGGGGVITVVSMLNYYHRMCSMKFNNNA